MDSDGIFIEPTGGIPYSGAKPATLYKQKSQSIHMFEHVTKVFVYFRVF